MAKTKLCATVVGKTITELRRLRDSQFGADLVELRLDSLDEPDVAAALSGRNVPVIATCRPVWEGGFFSGSEDERRDLLLEAQRLGAEYIDVEYRSGFVDRLVERSGGSGIVVSYHDFERTPVGLAGIYRNMRQTGAEVVKIATQVDSLCQGLELMSLGTSEEARVLIGMGPAGIPTRVLANHFGVSWSYAGNGVAPGQIDLKQMLDRYRFSELTSQTEIYGVIGKPVMHSVSPAMHNAGFRELKSNAVYLPLAAKNVEDFFGFHRLIPVCGVSVTAPYKSAVQKYCLTRDGVSQAVGAVNTLKKDGKGWIGSNTDVTGFLAPISQRVSMRNLRCAVLGAGGAARAVVWGLSRDGGKVTCYARNINKGTALSESLGVDILPIPPENDSWDLLVNATPVGTFPNVEETPLPKYRFDGRYVYDLVYNPASTRLLRDAKSFGCDTIGGLEMLANQAVQQFKSWTGVDVSIDLFLDAARNDLEQRNSKEDAVASAKGTNGYDV